jgi:hypothetical protein
MVWMIPNLKPLVKDLVQPTKCSAMLSTGYQLDTQLLQGTFSIQHYNGTIFTDYGFIVA